MCLNRSFSDLFVIGFEGGQPPMPTSANQPLWAGFVFGENNVPGERTRLRDTCAATVAAYEEKGQPPPILAIAHEGGGVHCLGDLATRFPLPGFLPDRRYPEVARITRQQARELRHLGLNFLFGPVCDISPESQRVRSGTILKRRTWGRYPLVVATRAEAARVAFANEGLMPCATHYPGMGLAMAPPAEGAMEPPVVPQSLAEWNDHDALPFYTAVKGGVHAVLAGNFIHQAKDRKNPIPLSSAWLKVLRREWSYAGTIVSDDLNALSRLLKKPLFEVVLEAFEAGIDLVQLRLGPEGDEKWDSLIGRLDAEASENLRLNRRLESARQRVIQLRRGLAPIPGEVPDELFVEGRRLKAEVEH